MAKGTSVWERYLQSCLLGLVSVAVVLAISSCTLVSTDASPQEDSRPPAEWTSADHAAYAEFTALRDAHLRKDIERNTRRIKELEDRYNGVDE